MTDSNRLFSPWLTVLPLIGIGATSALGQSLLPFNGRSIVSTGDAVPGLLLGEVFGGTSTFDNAVITDDGRIFFRGRFTGGVTTPLNDRALFFGDSLGNLSIVLRSGDPEPTGTIPGATLNTATGSGVAGSIRISAGGTMLIGVALSGGGVVSTNDTGLLVGTPGNFAFVIREGDPAPGTVGATISSSFSSPSQQNTAVIDGGYVLFQSTLTGGDVVGTTNNTAWFVGTPGGVSLMIRKGSIAAGGEVIANVSPAFVSQMNEAAEVMFDVSYVVGSGTNPVTTANDRALWINIPGTGNQELIREGGATPFPGVFYGNAGGTWTVNTASTTFNASGEALLRVDLTGAVLAGVDDSAIVKVSTAGHQFLVRRGDGAPGIVGGSFQVFNNTSMQLNDAGQIAFQASLDSPTITTGDDTGLFFGTPGNLQLVAREGDVAPGTGGGIFGAFSGSTMIMNNRGQILFNNTVTGGTNPDGALFCFDPATGVQPVILSNEQIEVAPGVFKGYASSGWIQFNNGKSRPLSFNDDGDFVLRNFYQDPTSGIVRGHLGSLFGYPESLSASTGGTHQWFLDAGAAQAGYGYLMLGSVTGTTPGFSAGAVTVPLNPDIYFNLTILYANTPVFTNTLATLDANARGQASLNIPPAIPGIVGVTLNHAYLGFNQFNAVKFASGAQSVTFVP